MSARNLSLVIIISAVIVSGYILSLPLSDQANADHQEGSRGEGSQCERDSSCGGCGPQYDSTGRWCGDGHPSCTSGGSCSCGGCGGGGGDDDEGDREPDPPGVNLYANGDADPITVSYNTSVLLSWDSFNSSNCQASGGWSGAKPDRGSERTGGLTSSQTFTLTCFGPRRNASDSVSVNVIMPVPNNPSNVTVTEPNYCVSGPSATVNWTYSDPSGSPQQSYQVQVDDQGSFQSPEVDSGKVSCSGCRSYFSGLGVLQFNTTYKARVRVWNSFNQVSGWTESGSFKTPNFAYPQVNFTWSVDGISEPPNPPKNSPVQFTDQTVFGGNPLQRKWNWLFGDGASSIQQNPAKTYTIEGTYYVTLTAEDSRSQTCSRTRGPLNVQKPIPVWKEVAPR